MLNIPKRHHYLPQSYLRQFGQESMVWVYDRKRDQIQCQNVLNTAVMKHFYSVELADGGRDAWVESELAKIDGIIPTITDELRRGCNLDERRKFDLSFIAATMMNRTPDFHEGIQRVEGAMIKKFGQMMYKDENEAALSIARWKAEDPEARDIDPKQVYEFFAHGNFNVSIHRNRSIELMLKLSPEFAKTLSRLNVAVLHAPKKSAFITTDRPFTIVPPRDLTGIPAWGGVGLLTPGANKYLALASDLAVVFGNPGAQLNHIDLTPRLVKGVNAAVGRMAGRFLLGRDEALVAAWAQRLALSTQPAVRTVDIG